MGRASISRLFPCSTLEKLWNPGNLRVPSRSSSRVLRLSDSSFVSKFIVDVFQRAPLQHLFPAAHRFPNETTSSNDLFPASRTFFSLFAFLRWYLASCLSMLFVLPPPLFYSQMLLPVQQTASAGGSRDALLPAPFPPAATGLE